MKIAGIDLSLTNTGIALLNTTDLLSPVLLSIKTKSTEAQFERWKRIRSLVVDAAKQTDLVVIEGYSFGSFESYSRAIAEIGGIVRFALGEAGIRFIDVPPARLKSFVAGTGKADKTAMVQAVNLRGMAIADHNLADAYGLALYGAALEGLIDLDHRQARMLADKPRRRTAGELARR